MRHPTFYKKFTAALNNLNALEAAVVYRTVTVDFTLHDVVAWLWPREVRDALTAAYRYTHASDCSPAAEIIKIAGPPHDPPAVAKWVTLQLNLSRIGMLRPRTEDIKIDAERGAPIMEALRHVERINQEFIRVRDVIQWLEENATLAAARYYFPSLCALVPSSHPIHRINGARYRDPVGIAAIIPAIREASATVASGLLCEPDEPIPTHGWMNVRVNGDPASQMFALL